MSVTQQTPFGSLSPDQKAKLDQVIQKQKPQAALFKTGLELGHKFGCHLCDFWAGNALGLSMHLCKIHPEAWEVLKKPWKEASRSNYLASKKKPKQGNGAGKVQIRPDNHKCPVCKKQFRAVHGVSNHIKAAHKGAEHKAVRERWDKKMAIRRKESQRKYMARRAKAEREGQTLAKNHGRAGRPAKTNKVSEVNFCFHCGNNLSSIATPNFCPACGTRLA